MEVRNIEQKYRKIDAPFSDLEYARFKTFIKKNGLKTGAWVKRVIIAAMKIEEKARSNGGSKSE